jgi:hypothetical protein
MINRMTTALTASAIEAHAGVEAPWTQTLVGLVVTAIGGFLIVRTPAAQLDKPHMVFYGGVLLVGLVIVPGVRGALRGAATEAIAIWRDFKNPPPTLPPGGAAA